jgi:hypothetical protein
MRRIAPLFLLCLALLGSPPAWALDVDLELVLAIDASSSVDETEFALQMGGIAAAFREPRVLEAIKGGRTGRIAVAIVMWADATVPKAETDWHVIESRDDALAFADLTARLPRGVVGGTGIGAGIAVAIRKFDRNGIEGERQVVDVSGDGSETPPREIVVTMPTARSMALARGVTINGLAILNEDEQLEQWYRNHVIAGANSFVITVGDFDDFAEAMTRKLIREIDDRPKLGLLR